MLVYGHHCLSEREDSALYKESPEQTIGNPPDPVFALSSEAMRVVEIPKRRSTLETEIGIYRLSTPRGLTSVSVSRAGSDGYSPAIVAPEIRGWRKL